MPLYELVDSRLARCQRSTFADLGLYERKDLQRLIRDDVSALDDDLLVIAEEFGEWEDARRRIDLLAIDKSGRLVVIELKRDDGAHMDLQALRYAAMVSSMDFDDILTTLQAHLAASTAAAQTDARTVLTTFLDAGEEEEPTISTDVRIVLVSADFGRELTTAVLWLNRFEGIDIRCQLVPYKLDDRVVLDVRQIVPLPEAAEYQVRVRRKEQQQERARIHSRDMTRYHVIVDGTELPDENKRNTVRRFVSKLIERGVSPHAIAEVITPARLRSVDGEPDDLLTAFSDVDPKFDPTRWFMDGPFRSNGRTWLLNNQWGVTTEPTLTALCDKFPDVGVSFRQAEKQRA